MATKVTISDAVNSTESYTAASSAAVKNAYDKAASAEQTANNAMPKSGGTFTGQIAANATAMTSLGTAQIRNVIISATDLTAGSSSLATGSSYHVYQ